MRHLPKRYAMLAVVATAAMGLAACGGSSGTTSGSGSGTPVKGGTLKVVAASGMDHFDTVSAYGTWDYMFERAFARQLVTYPFAAPKVLGDAAWKKAVTPVPDIATAMPTITNGGKTYTFHIKQGVMWNTSRRAR